MPQALSVKAVMQPPSAAQQPVEQVAAHDEDTQAPEAAAQNWPRAAQF